MQGDGGGGAGVFKLCSKWSLPPPYSTPDACMGHACVRFSQFKNVAGHIIAGHAMYKLYCKHAIVNPEF